MNIVNAMIPTIIVPSWLLKSGLIAGFENLAEGRISTNRRTSFKMLKNIESTDTYGLIITKYKNIANVVVNANPTCTSGYAVNRTYNEAYAARLKKNTDRNWYESESLVFKSAINVL